MAEAARPGAGGGRDRAKPTTINGIPIDGSAPVPGSLIATIAAIGLPMLLGAAWLAHEDLLFLLSADSASGRVARITAIEDRPRPPIRTTYAPELVFTPRGSAELRVVSPDARREACCDVGEAVTVRFPPGEPQRARVLGFAQDFAVPTFLGGFGLVWTSLAAVLMRARWRHGRRLARGEIAPEPPEAGAAVVVTAHLAGLRREDAPAGPRWVVQARGILPMTGAVRIFEGPPLPFDPTPQMGHMTTVQVRIERTAPDGAYEMDLSFLRRPAGT